MNPDIIILTVAVWTFVLVIGVFLILYRRQ